MTSIQKGEGLLPSVEGGDSSSGSATTEDREVSAVSASASHFVDRGGVDSRVAESEAGADSTSDEAVSVARAMIEGAVAKLACCSSSAKAGIPLTASAASVALGSLSLHARFHCDICGTDLTSSFRIRCAECRDFDLCLNCFCSGRASGGGAGKRGHSNSHAYIPVGRQTFPLFDVNWAAEEELLLLEGVSKYGFGNWLVSRKRQKAAARLSKKRRRNSEREQAPLCSGSF